jgi:hypothetical protein
MNPLIFDNVATLTAAAVTLSEAAFFPFSYLDSLAGNRSAGSPGNRVERGYLRPWLPHWNHEEKNEGMPEPPAYSCNDPFLGCWGLVWWQRGEVERVTAEVATLQDQANDLAKRGGRPCSAPVDRNTGCASGSRQSSSRTAQASPRPMAAPKARLGSSSTGTERPRVSGRTAAGLDLSPGSSYVFVATGGQLALDMGPDQSRSKPEKTQGLLRSGRAGVRRSTCTGAGRPVSGRGALADDRPAQRGESHRPVRRPHLGR